MRTKSRDDFNIGMLTSDILIGLNYLATKTNLSVLLKIVIYFLILSNVEGRAREDIGDYFGYQTTRFYKTSTTQFYTLT